MEDVNKLSTEDRHMKNREKGRTKLNPIDALRYE
jgi:hypothetical protein